MHCYTLPSLHIPYFSADLPDLIPHLELNLKRNRALIGECDVWIKASLGHVRFSCGRWPASQCPIRLPLR